MEKDDIRLEDLQEQHQQYAQVIGVDNMIALAQEYGGTQIYIPKVDELIKNRKYRAISKGYEEGMTIKELAAKYQVSESTVYRLVREQIVRGVRNIPGQMSIADYDASTNL